MDTVCTQGVINEAKASIDALADPIEGLEDDLRLNIQEETRTVVTARLDDLKRRRTLLQSVVKEAEENETAIVALLADGYPIIVVEAVSDAVADDLADQRRQREAADALFTRRVLTTGVNAHVSDVRPTP